MANTLDIIFCGVDKERLRNAMMNEKEKYDVVDLYPREQIAKNDYFIINGFKNQIRQASEEKEIFADLSGQICLVTLPQEEYILAIYINHIFKVLFLLSVGLSPLGCVFSIDFLVPCNKL